MQCSQSGYYNKEYAEAYYSPESHQLILPGQCLLQDMRLMRPAAWIDWQYVEDNNDQWCLVQGDFYGGTQEFHRVKNYYVRQQFSRFMREGYRFVETTEEHTLAAVSPTGDTLVVVSVNRAAHDRQMQVDMSGISRKGTKQKKARAYRTSGTENLAELPKGTIKTDHKSRDTEADRIKGRTAGHAKKAVLQKNAKSRVPRRKAAKPPKKALQTPKKLSYRTIQNVL